MVKLWTCGLAVLMVVSGGLWLWLRPSDPTSQAAVNTSYLYEATRSLSTNLEDTNTAQATKRYLAILASMQSDCKNITSNSKRVMIGAPGVNTVDSSALLCADLTQVVGYTQGLYTPISPLLNSSTVAMRFESLWPFAGMIRQRHLAEIAAARSQLAHHPGDLNFNTNIVGQLSSLNTVVAHDPGLSYLGALQAFQVSSLGERTTYWLNYVQLAALELRLQGQVNSYCQELGISLQGCQ